ncbi:class I SAM-dependent methyltransferase [Nocardioides acrostichi]|uniref:Class I SAM-dependent methyltransferase n=1 Tax=Nocardioides acrostichi TaxID=2784339 RepID=A0A930UZK7_9ACTN|nr:class I SAM-dependent methyltransferase [Nocardioides acrostichi]MBF4161146.1 class I SAM-dependent methyltransferase [Nocardioides acrostichi]
MGFFDFLDDLPRYAEKKLAINRLNTRHDLIVTPFAEELSDARVLDLAAHDGRWSYALAAAGAREVVGVEARADMAAQFADYPEGAVKQRVSQIVGDMYDVLPTLRDQTFDVVAVYGVFYHVMDHYRLLRMIRDLSPRLVIVDSEFALAPEPVIRIAREDPEVHLNTIERAESGGSPIGVPSFSAMELMAESLGWSTEWTDWQRVPRRKRGGLKSYYREPPAWKRRGTCALRPA